MDDINLEVFTQPAGRRLNQADELRRAATLLRSFAEGAEPEGAAEALRILKEVRADWSHGYRKMDRVIVDIMTLCRKVIRLTKKRDYPFPAKRHVEAIRKRREEASDLAHRTADHIMSGPVEIAEMIFNTQINAQAVAQEVTSKHDRK